MNRVSLIFGMIGTGFIICTFAFASAHYLQYSDKARNIAGLNIFFALSASIVTTFVGSAIFGKGRVGYKEVLVGSVRSQFELTCYIVILKINAKT